VVPLAADDQGRGRTGRSEAPAAEPIGEALMGEMGAGHFIYIPSMILIGIVIGWILGSRAARDAFAAELRRREDDATRKAAKAAKAAERIAPSP
jgi:hypothetical protein